MHPVYKIGQSKNIRGRINEYPPGSALLLTCQTQDCVSCEKLIMLRLGTHKRRLDLGKEYYEGDLGSIMMVVVECALGTGLPETTKAWRVLNARKASSFNVDRGRGTWDGDRALCDPDAISDPLTYPF